MSAESASRSGFGRASRWYAFSQFVDAQWTPIVGSAYEKQARIEDAVTRQFTNEHINRMAEAFRRAAGCKMRCLIRIAEGPLAVYIYCDRHRLCTWVNTGDPALN